MGGARGRRIVEFDRLKAVRQVNEAVASGSSVESACGILKISTRTYRRWKKDPSGDKRKGPISTPSNKLGEAEKSKIISIATSKEYCDKSPAQIVPLLADKGEYVASESSFYRVLKANKLDAHRSKSKPKTRRKPKTLKAEAPNQVYSWDITYLPLQIKGMFVYLYFFLDIYSRKIVGHEVHDEQNSEYASVLIKRICEEENIDKDQLHLHSDNGGPMKGATMLSTLQTLGVMPSFSRPSVSDDNPFSESLFKTTKYCPLYPSKPFSSIEEAREWVERFVEWYNNEHLHSGIKFVTPNDRHEGLDIDILKKRNDVYERAKKRNPNRWSGKTRNWEHKQEVFLNPLKQKTEGGTNKAA